MPTLHVEVTLTVDDLVKAAQRLDDDDFERFMVAMQWVASRRGVAVAPAPDAPGAARGDGAGEDDSRR